MKTIIAGSINDKEVPWFKFRETLYRDVYDPEFMARVGFKYRGVGRGYNESRIENDFVSADASRTA